MNNNNLLLMGVSGAILIYFMMDRTERAASKVREMKLQGNIQYELEKAKSSNDQVNNNGNKLIHNGRITDAIQEPTIVEDRQTKEPLIKPTLFDPFKFQTAQDYQDELKRADELYKMHRDPNYGKEPVYPNIEVFCTNKGGCDITGKMKK